MKNIKEKFKSTFLKNVIMITSGTAFAQILTTALLPIITRLYSPEEYGVISVYSAILVVVSFLGSMNYEMGVPIADSKQKAINILMLSILTLFLFTIIQFLIFMSFGDAFLELLNGEVLKDFKYLIPISSLLLGLYSIFTQWSYRKKDFKAITKTKINQALSQNIISIGFGILGKGPIGLIIGKVFGQSAGISTLSSSLFTKERYLFRSITKKELMWAARRYISFPLFTTPRNFLGNITMTIPILLITSMYGGQIVGLFAFANSVIQLPMNLIGTSIGNVFYAETAAVRHTDPERVKNLANKLLKNLVIIGAFPLIILIFLGPVLFSIVFGKEWGEAGIFASILSVSAFTRLILKPISSIFDIYEKQGTALILNIFRVSLVLIFFGISSYYSLNSYWAVGLYSIAIVLSNLIEYLVARKILSDRTSGFR